MQCGISTSCFYPKDTLASLQALADMGIQTVEIFLNTVSEMDEGYLSRLQDVVQKYQIKVAALHPWSSFMDGFFFASAYEGRMQDGIKLYRKYFEICQYFGAGKLVFHGCTSYFLDYYPLASYVDNFCLLADIAKEYGVTLCHENVSYCVLGDPATVRAVRPLLAGRAAFVLDAKQARRFGVQEQDMFAAMQGAIRHVHISDFSAEKNCLPPGEGVFDFYSFLSSLAKSGYDDTLIIEVYRDNFTHGKQLLKAKEYIDGILHQLSSGPLVARQNVIGRDLP